MRNKFVDVIGRNTLYILDNPITFTQKEYYELKLNPKVELEFDVLLIDPPRYRLRGIQLPASTMNYLKRRNNQ